MTAPKTRITDLGQLSGDILVFGGAYSNLQATQAFFDVARKRAVPAERIIFTGDAIAYCANPVETFHCVNGNCAYLAGNCEIQLAEGADDCGCGFGTGTACEIRSREWYPYANEKMQPTDRAILGALPDLVVFQHNGRRHAVIHGGLTDVSRFIWPSSPESMFQEEVAAIEAIIGDIDVVMAGHNGIAFCRDVAGVEWVNTGAIGIPPHDGRPETRFVTLGDLGQRIERLHSDHDQAAAAMRNAGLCQGYQDTLLSGYWPSEEILPPELRGRLAINP